MTSDLFAADCKFTPYWWDRVPRPAATADALLARTDVLVIGSGYTGLSAAIELARGGRQVQVIDAEDVGFGCSTRNGGQISTSIKPGFVDLARRHGQGIAHEIIRDGQQSLAWVKEFVAREGIDCDLREVGRFHAAHNPRQYELLARAISNQPKGLEVEAFAVPRADQHNELGTDAYFGGVVYPRHASIDPAKFHQGMLACAKAAGVIVVGHAPATAIARAGDGFRVTTTKGQLIATQVVVATNGYTGALTPWLRRRVIPIGSYIIATEPLRPEVMARLFPKDRIASDTRKVVYYYRASPDRTRILFGGRVSFDETDPQVSGPLLHAAMTGIFPELAHTKISHSWAGMVAYTFDELAHIGEQDGLFYAMGYCGSGVGMAGYLGMRLAQVMLGRPEGRTGLSQLRFQTRPFYTGNPWFLAPSVMFYRWRDRLGW